MRGWGGKVQYYIPEFAPTEHSFAVFLHSFVASLLHVAHQLPGYKIIIVFTFSFQLLYCPNKQVYYNEKVSAWCKNFIDGSPAAKCSAPVKIFC